MSEIGEAIGTATEGGLFARAVEQAKADQAAAGVESACLNCETPLVGSHCHHCGQKAAPHRTIRAFLHDLVHGALHFEGKIWHTLPLLAFKPGKLTREYIDGKRARHVSPMALFLFTVFTMFAVFQIAGISTPTDFDGEIGGARERAVAARSAFEAELEALPQEETERRAKLEERIEEVSEAISAIEEGRNYAFTDEEGRRTYQNITLTGIEAIDHGIVAKWRANPGLMLYKLQTNFYKFSWLLIPLSVPFVWLLFLWKRHFKAYDHAIFVTYSLSFMTLLILAATLLGIAGAWTAVIVLPLVFIPPVHMYKHLRGTYGLSRFSALWRLCVLTVFIMIVLLIFLQLLLAIGAF